MCQALSEAWGMGEGDPWPHGVYNVAGKPNMGVWKELVMETCRYRK